MVHQYYLGLIILKTGKINVDLKISSDSSGY